MIDARKERAPAVLLPYQQRWVADEHPVKICEKSRRTGFSWGTAAECALLAARRDGMDCWYVGYNREMAEEFIRDSADWARHFGKAAAAIEEVLIEDEKEQILTFVIRFDSGYRITALSSRPTNLRGKQGYVVLDEFAFHDKKRELLKAAIALLMWGGRVAIISTHDGVDNEFNTLLSEIRAGKKPYSLHRVTLDDAMREGLFRRICLRTGRAWSEVAEEKWRAELVDFYGDAAEEELFCVPRQSGGAYLPRALVEARMIDAPVLRFSVAEDFAQRSDDYRASFVDEWCREHLLPLLEALPKDLRHAFGEDFGRTGDLTVIAPITLGQTLVRRVPFLVELRRMPFRQQEQILFFIVDRLPRLAAGALDARGNGQFLAEVSAQRYGASRVQQVMLSDKWYLENMPPFKAALEDALFEVPRDEDVLSDMRALQVVGGVPKLVDAKRKGSDGGQRHGDAAIALVLAHAASRMNVSTIEFLSASTRASSGVSLSVGRTDTRGF